MATTRARAKKGTINQDAECLHCGGKLVKPALTYDWSHEASGTVDCPDDVTEELVAPSSDPEDLL